MSPTARYKPWWMPTAIVVLLLLSMTLLTVLIMQRGGGKIAEQSKHSNHEVIQWDMVTSWPKNFPGLGTGPENFAKMVKDMSDGRLIITVHGANSIVPALGVFDAVSSGSVEMGHSAAYYWKGKMPAAPFFTSVPFGMNVIEYNGWLRYGGGLKLWRDLYKPYHVIPFAGGNTGVQMGGWFNREINSIKDIQGLKMRIPGLGGEVFTRAGGTAVNIPASELYNALQTGVIDATEWVGPYNDLAIGFHQIAKYYYYPGWHEPGPALEFIVNEDAYNSLPPDLQAIIEAATRAVNEDMLDEYEARSLAALDELKNHYKVDIRPFPPDVLAEFRRQAMAIYRETEKSDPTFARIAHSYFDYMEQAKGYADITEKAYYELR